MLSARIVHMDENQERIDRAIWRGIGVKSVRVIAEEVGLSVDEVLKRKNELREEVDVLSIQDKRMKILVDLDESSRRLQDDYDNAPFEFKAGIMNSAISAMKTIMTELNRLEGKSSAEVDALNQLRVKELFSLVKEAVDTSVEEIAEMYSLDSDEVFEVFNVNLMKAAQKREIEQ